MTSEIELRRRATDMRRNPTEPEVRLWRALSNSQLGTFKFRRQHVIAPYICDFFCPAKGLVVQVDGDTHDAAHDERRDAYLTRRGFHVLRFGNGDVMANIDGVAAAILMKLHALPDRWLAPHPNPSPEGEGLSPVLSPSPSGEGLGVGEASQRPPPC